MNDKTPPAETSPPKKRKKSQNRQRTERMSAALTKTEFNQAAAKITAAGYTRGAYLRAALLGSAGPRSLHALPVEADLLRQLPRFQMPVIEFLTLLRIKTLSSRDIGIVENIEEP